MQYFETKFAKHASRLYTVEIKSEKESAKAIIKTAMPFC